MGPINARWRGVQGDGRTDDTASALRAIEAAPSGGRVFFPAGTYLINGLEVVGKSRLIIEGEQGTIFKLPDGADVGAGRALLSLQDTQRVTVRHIRFDGNAARQGANTSDLLRLTNTLRTTITDCDFIDSDATGIRVTSGRDTGILNCLFSGNRATSVHLQPQAGPLDGVIISNCIVETPAGFTALTEFARPFQFIPAGGVFPMNIRVTDCRIDGNADGSSLPYRDGIWVHAQNVTIKGCSIRNLRDDCITVAGGQRLSILGNHLYDSQVTGGVVFVISDNEKRDVVISGNHIYNHAGNGIDVNQNVVNVVISNNTIQRCGLAGRGPLTHGIGVLGLDSFRPRGLVIEGNIIRNNLVCGISVDQADRVIIRGNHCLDNGDGSGSDPSRGIRIFRSSGSIIDGNTAHSERPEMTQIGIVLDAATQNCLVAHNIVAPTRTGSNTLVDNGTNNLVKDNIGHAR